MQNIIENVNVSVSILLLYVSGSLAKQFHSDYEVPTIRIESWLIGFRQLYLARRKKIPLQIVSCELISSKFMLNWIRSNGELERNNGTQCFRRARVNTALLNF